MLWLRSKVNKQQRSALKKRTAFAVLIFFHPDCNCWSRSFTGSADTELHPVADFTASGELHPALKTKYSVVFLGSVYPPIRKNATPNLRNMKKYLHANYLRCNYTGEEGVMLFENISTIGLLKALGMTDKAISKVFLSSSAVLLLKGMAIGNVLAFLFCFIQEKTHFLKMNPENYFVSFVPVDVNVGAVIAADAISFAVILLLLLIPTIFISKVDPAQTVRVK